MFPIRLERDTNIVAWQGYEAGWCTDSNPITANNQVRSDGVLHPDYAVIDMNGATGAMLTREATFIGLHIAAPEDDSGFTCYQIHARAQCDGGDIRPILVIGEAQTVTSDATGDQIKQTRLLDVASFRDLEGGMLKTEMTIACPPLPTAGKNPCFAVGMLNGVGTSSNLNAWVHLSVRRLVGVNPKILDATKLG